MNTNELKQEIEKLLEKSGGKIAVHFNDLNGHIININADEPFESASCLKMFVLTELFRRVNVDGLNLNNKIIYDKKEYTEGSGVMQYLTSGLEMSLKDIATLMIIVSDNVATNILIDYLGLDNINKTIKNLGINHSVVHNKIDFTMDGLGTITAKDYGFIFEKLAKRELYSPDISQQMIDILVNQKYQEMILTDDMRRCFIENGGDIIKYIASKSGRVEGIWNDGGIVSTVYGDYVIVILIKGFEDAYELNDGVYDIGLRISELVFKKYVHSH